jgi:hypothetical protein
MGIAKQSRAHLKFDFTSNLTMNASTTRLQLAIENKPAGLGMRIGIFRDSSFIGQVQYV